MAEDLRTVCLNALSGLLRPIVSFCLRRSLKLQDVTEALKQVFIDVATVEMERQGVEVSMSRLSVMTGVHRRDVARLSGDDPERKREVNLMTRVLGQWQQDRRYRGKNGVPRKLTVEGMSSEFAELVQSVSKDLNPYTILFELERIGAIERVGDCIKLKSAVYVPSGNLRNALSLLSNDAEDLILSVEENIFDKPDQPNLHIKTQYDNICEESIAEIREWFLKKGTAFHEEARKFLGRFDKDLNPALRWKKGGVRAAIGTFSRVEIAQDSKELQEKRG